MFRQVGRCSQDIALNSRFHKNSVSISMMFLQSSSIIELMSHVQPHIFPISSRVLTYSGHRESCVIREHFVDSDFEFLFRFFFSLSGYFFFWIQILFFPNSTQYLHMRIQDDTSQKLAEDAQELDRQEN